MAKIEKLKGFIKVVSPIQELTDEKKTKIQYMVFFVPGYTDGFGQKKGKDQTWLLQALGDRIEKLKLSDTLEGSKASITFYAESFCLEAREEGKKPFYVVNNTLESYEIIP
jgi:hypothetical protein